MGKMKTIECSEPYAFRMLEADIPKPGPGEVLLRVRRIGVCGTDLHAFQGNQPFFTYPRILGHELAGTVEVVHKDERILLPGDEAAVVPYLECGTCIACRSGKTNCCVQLQVLGVHTDGGMQEYIVVPSDHLIRTKGMPLDHAAMLEPLSIGAHAVRRASLTPGERVLVIGAGPIGLGVMAFAKAKGAHVIAMDMNAERLRFCASWAGVDDTVHAAEATAALTALGNGDLPAVVFDATGNARSMTAAFDYTAHGGTLVYVGLVKSDITFHDPLFHKKELTLMGSRNATAEDFEEVIRTVKAGGIDLGRYITHRAAFDDVIDAFEAWLQPESKVIKAIICIDKEKDN
jgi:2-desacetyl-2-hydroxyethyl bacteriochlorophyllide A dehydrogenase